jgi:hypothetical protein
MYDEHRLIGPQLSQAISHTVIDLLDHGSRGNVGRKICPGLNIHFGFLRSSGY